METPEDKFTLGSLLWMGLKRSTVEEPTGGNEALTGVISSKSETYEPVLSVSTRLASAWAVLAVCSTASESVVGS